MRVVFAGYRLDIGDALFVLERLGGANPRGIGAVFICVALLVSIACWSIAWLRVREAQVSDGV